MQDQVIDEKQIGLFDAGNQSNTFTDDGLVPGVPQVEIYEDEKEKTRLSRRKRDKNMLKVIGQNLKVARQVSGRTTTEMMRLIWKAEPGEKNLNRISEIENGLQTPSLSVLVELAEIYGCSLDYIFGLSPEFERDLIASQTGVVVTAIRETSMDMCDSMTRAVLGLIGNMPPVVGQALLDSAKRAVGEFERCQHDLVFTSHYKHFFELFDDLRNKTHDYDRQVARTFRLVSATYDSVLDREEEKHRLLMEQKIAPPPATLDNSEVE